MECEILSKGLLPNQAPEKGATNPHECHEYSYTVEHEETELFVSHTSWSLSGDIPAGISIDSTSGLISGKVKPFNEQPSCTDNHPKEKITKDGSNYEKNGRFKPDTYEFKFSIARNYKVTDDTKIPLIDESVSSDVSILVVKNNDIDNYLFVTNYLKAGHDIVVDGIKYKEHSISGTDIMPKTTDGIKELMKVHEGPFGECT